MINKENLINNLEIEEYLTQMQSFEIKMAGYFFLVLNKQESFFYSVLLGFHIVTFVIILT